MKTLLRIIIVASALYVGAARAQCTYDNALYLTLAAPATIGSTVTATQTWGGEFNRITGMQAGYTYEISTCNSVTFDSEITVYPSGGGSSLAHDDDGCGTVGGSSKVSFTPLTSGDYDILLDEFNCLDNTIDMDMSVTLISTGGSGNPGTLNIPVVVHVIYKNATENISDSQIRSQIDVLNLDYRKLNPDFAQTPAAFQSLGADMNITFCLASVDPDGAPTTGITRTSTTVQQFDHSTEPKFTANGGHDNWDPQHYLNMWVCDLGGGLLGYATFPSDLTSDPQLDGVVMDYEYFGNFNTTAPYDLGRTATHEVGHWLNLRHIWGDSFCGDDFVNDTPTQEQSNFGCPNFPHASCSNGPNGDMFMNFMDYTDDACMFMFTTGQKQRTDATIATTRNGLIAADGCGVTGIDEKENAAAFTIYPNPADNNISITMKNISVDDITFKIYNIVGAEVLSRKLSGTDSNTTIDISSLKKGVYLVEATSGGIKNVSKLIVQ
jgi:hypothetical protein